LTEAGGPAPAVTGGRASAFWKWALLVGGVAMLVRVLVILLVDPHVPEVGDASAYHLLANNLADGRGYIRPFDLAKFGRVVPTAEYPPLHPFVLSLFARLGARSVEAQRIGLAVIGSGTAVLVAYLGRRAAGVTVGVVAGLIAACYPMLFLPDATLMSESLFVFFVALALLLAYAVIDRPTPLRFAALGLVLGFATLTRAEAIVLGAFLVIPIAWRVRDATVLRRIGLAALVVVVAVVVVAPWSIRNQRTFHSFVPVSNSLVQIVDGANCRLTYGGPFLGSWRSTFGNADARGDECFEGFNGSEPGFDEAKAAEVSRRDGLEYIRDHVGDLPKVGAARLLRTFGLFRPAQQTQLEALEGRPLGWERTGTGMYYVLAVAAIGGFVVLLRRKATLWPLAAAVLTVVLSSIMTYGTQRFRITAEPAIVVFAAVGFVALARLALGGGDDDRSEDRTVADRPVPSGETVDTV
jgi:4-amino-4-deoxy-L-arabinose transferase-like glycosyltransferase